MKYTIIIVLLLATAMKSLGKTSKSECINDSLILQLSQMNLPAFNGQPVDSFIARIPNNYLSLKIMGGWRVDIADVLVIQYSDSIYIEVFVFEFTHMNPRNPNRLPPSQAWSITDFRKEKISYIKIYNNAHCLNGCENP